MNTNGRRDIPTGHAPKPSDFTDDILHDPNMCTSHTPQSSADCTDLSGMFPEMEPFKRLIRARKDAGYRSGRQGAEAMGANYNTYAQHENGTRELTADAAIRYARFFRVSLEWLLTGKGTPKSVRLDVPVVCYVGAGAEVYPIDDHAKGQGLEMVPAPVGMEDCVAARVVGTSMHPMMRNGWLIFWHKDQDGVPEEALGQPCVVQVTDGPLLVKDLRRGSKKGTYRLESFNAEPMEDVKLDWASRITEIRPR